jgi:thymidylate synthase
MHVTYRNVNDAFVGLVGLFADTNEGPKRGDIVCRGPSRYGEVLYINEPMTITYTHPRERVLFNAARDANPFFHLYEALWMLAGRRDVAPLMYYNKRMVEFSDDGEVLNGAYGYRWRHHIHHDITDNPECDTTNIHTDQLQVIINHLRANPTSRRAVLAMWNVEYDLLKVDTSKDCTCNLNVMFSLRCGPCQACGGRGYIQRLEQHPTGLLVNMGTQACSRCNGQPANKPNYLDMTVTNRSNDAIWGLLGANYVHFTVLQEYVANCLGVDVGMYHHFSNNLHVYTNNWKPEEWLVEQPRAYPGTATIPLVQDQATFDEEVKALVQQYSGHEPMAQPFREYKEPWLRTVAQPLLDAWLAHKKHTNTALSLHAASCAAPDWRLAATMWLQRRVDRARQV